MPALRVPLVHTLADPLALLRRPRARWQSLGLARRVTVLALLVVVLASLPATFLLTTSGGWGDAPGQAALHVIVIAVPIAAGLYAVRRPHSVRFGRMLIAVGLMSSLAVLGESPQSVPYSIGRVATWAVFPPLVYLMLGFPEGRLTLHRDRVMFRSLVALILVLYAGSALLVESFPRHSPWATCTTDCPPNAFQVPESEPELLDSFVVPLRDSLSVILLIGVSLSLAARLRAASAVRKVTIAPVVAVSIGATLVLATFLTLRGLSADAQAVRAVGVAWALTVPALGAAFFVGLVRRRLLIGNVLSRLSLAFRDSLNVRDLAAALRPTIGDPRAEVLLRDPAGAGWLHEDGQASEPSDTPGRGRIMRPVEVRGKPVAAVVFDADVDADDVLVDAVVSLTGAALRQTSLKAELETSLSDLDDSRKRIATAADRERRRIERDLHDGAQQRLIALRMRLSLAEDLLRENPESAAQAIQDLGEDVELALEEIRSLAHGIYPALLADRGLPDALSSVARRCSLPMRVDAAGVTRHPPDIESAVYFTCTEATQNAVKHAGDATRIRVSLTQGRALEFTVADDGRGFDHPTAAAGAGLRNMRDRVESVGGRLTVQSSPGRGTVVAGTVPLPAHLAPSGPRGNGSGSAHSP